MSQSYSAEFRAAAAVFVLAGVVGVWMRYAQFFGGFGTLNFANVRHAHSHLMLFTWGVPISLMFIGERLVLGHSGSEQLTTGLNDDLFARFLDDAQASSASANVDLVAHSSPSIDHLHCGRVLGPAQGYRRAVRAAMGLGLLTFLPFFFLGYRPFVWGGFRVPFAIVISTTIIFAWYWVIAAYLKARVGLKTTLGWDVVMLSLGICTIGAWGRAIFTAAGLGDTLWASGAVQAFLTTLTDGVLVLGILAAMADDRKAELPASLKIWFWGLPVSFLAYMDVPTVMRAIGSAASAVFLVGLLSALWAVKGTRARFAWTAAITIVSLRLAYLIPYFGERMSGAGFRVLGLHWIFLGVVSLGALELRGVDSRWVKMFALAVAALLVGILPTTAMWPVELAGAGRWVTMVTSGLPPFVMLGWLLASANQRVVTNSSTT